jgi:hypothetical protein
MTSATGHTTYVALVIVLYCTVLQLGAGRAAEYETLKQEARRVTQSARDELEAANRALTAGKVILLYTTVLLLYFTLVTVHVRHC